MSKQDDSLRQPSPLKEVPSITTGDVGNSVVQPQPSHSCNFCPHCGGVLSTIAPPVYDSLVRTKFGCPQCGLKWEVRCQKSHDEELIAIYPIDQE